MLERKVNRRRTSPEDLPSATLPLPGKRLYFVSIRLRQICLMARERILFECVPTRHICSSGRSQTTEPTEDVPAIALTSPLLNLAEPRPRFPDSTRSAN